MDDVTVTTQGKNGGTLIPFKPGEDERRNTGGRPKGRSITTVLNGLLDGEVRFKDDDTGQDRELTRGEYIALVLLKKAMSGDLKAIHEILNRTEGKAPQTLDINANVAPDEQRGRICLSALTMDELREFERLCLKIEWDAPERVLSFREAYMLTHGTEPPADS